MSAEKPEIDGFTAHAVRWAECYWYLRCRCCGMTWYLPRDPDRRTRGALLVLAEHAEQHDDDYDAADDMTRSLQECYGAVRARVAAGGKGWLK